jgi:uncharacterized metal-binding protein
MPRCNDGIGETRTVEINCAKCPFVKKACRVEAGKGPPGCPTLNQKEALDRALKEYEDPALLEFAIQSSRQEAECYAHREAKPFVMHPTKCRLEEIIEFSRKMGYKKLGVAFCGGVTHEAAILSDVLEGQGFEVVAVSCKVGGVPKEKIGLNDNEKVRIGTFEPMCNPIAQAEVLNEAGTDFNIMIGLCVGHDSLFFKYAKAMTTVFATKDRVTGHNAMASLYTIKSYSSRFRKAPEGREKNPKERLVADGVRKR